jgi:hypothetical protein
MIDALSAAFWTEPGQGKRTSVHAAAEQFGRFRSEAGIGPRSPSPIYEYTA